MSFHLLPGAADAAADLAPADAGAPGSLSLALSALAARLRAVEARIEREPRWVPGLAPGEVCPVQQRLSLRTQGRPARFVERLEARDLRALQAHLSRFAPSCPVEPPLSPAPGQGGAL